MTVRGYFLSHYSFASSQKGNVPYSCSCDPWPCDPWPPGPPTMAPASHRYTPIPTIVTFFCGRYSMLALSTRMWYVHLYPYMCVSINFLNLLILSPPHPNTPSHILTHPHTSHSWFSQLPTHPWSTIRKTKAKHSRSSLSVHPPSTLAPWSLAQHIPYGPWHLTPHTTRWALDQLPVNRLRWWMITEVSFN